ncbi:MAG: hypothetical protein CMK83_13650 [Pseudomonadales bacterium]|nr:hypothetical protein [Pseudomonadales bacterium]MBI27895.1 hypothetical protein [Pseudomonadales bacterium]
MALEEYRTFSSGAFEGSNGDKPSVLYVTNNLPIPPTSGGQLREYQLLLRLKEYFDIHLVAFVPDIDQASNFVNPALEFLVSVTFIKTINQLAPAHTPNRVRAHFAPAGKDVVSMLLAKFDPDLVHVEGYFLVHYLPETSCPPVVLTEENIEYELEAAGEKYGYYPMGSSQLTQEWEVRVWNRVDQCVAVTDEDREIITVVGKLNNVECIPGGMDHLDLNNRPIKRDTNANCTFLYIGNYRWPPSEDAAWHLLQDIWPVVSEISPHSQLVFAGVGMSDKFVKVASDASRVIVHGPFKHLDELMMNTSVFLFPLRFGGGQKMKLVEVIAAGMPVVTTSLALRGFPKEVVPYLSIVDNEVNSFAEAAIAALNSPRASERARYARTTLNLHLPSWDEAASLLSQLWFNNLSFDV